MTRKTTIEHSLGNIMSKHVIYLPTPPQLPAGEVNTQTIIDLNGNHWRKIFTIIAKLMCGDNDWKNYREVRLLNDVHFNFGKTLINETNRQHFVCGKAHWESLQLTPLSQQFIAFDEQGKAWARQRSQDGMNIMLLPYPDYRQFNNALIELVKPSVQSV